MLLHTSTASGGSSLPNLVWPALKVDCPGGSPTIGHGKLVRPPRGTYAGFVSPPIAGLPRLSGRFLGHGPRRFLSSTAARRLDGSAGSHAKAEQDCHPGTDDPYLVDHEVT